MITGIMVDQREPDWVKALTFGDIPMMVTLLESGDFLATTDKGELLAIERKTPSDLLASIPDGRLLTQVAGMREKTPWVYLLITGALVPNATGMVAVEGISTGWNWSSIQGALLEAQEMGAFVVFARDDDDLEAAILRLGNHDRGAVKLRKERDTLAISVAELVLTALPGIGETRAAAIMKYAGTLGWALCYLTDSEFDVQIEGIGRGTKQKVREALALRDGEVISVIGKDGQPAKIADREAA